MIISHRYESGSITIYSIILQGLCKPLIMTASTFGLSLSLSTHIGRLKYQTFLLASCEETVIGFLPSNEYFYRSYTLLNMKTNTVLAPNLNTLYSTNVSKVQKWNFSLEQILLSLLSTQVHKLYIARAKQLEEMRQLKEAEKLYVIVGEPDFAISMYKRNKQVSFVKPSSHIHLTNKLGLIMFILQCTWEGSCLVFVACRTHGTPILSSPCLFSMSP